MGREITVCAVIILLALIGRIIVRRQVFTNPPVINEFSKPQTSTQSQR